MTMVQKRPWRTISITALVLVLGLFCVPRTSVGQENSDVRPLAGTGFIGFDYGPFRRDESPALNKYPAADNMREDLAILATFTKTIRTYSVTNGLEAIPQLAERFGISVVIGAWLSGNPVLDQREINSAIRLCRENENVILTVLGSEAILRFESRQRQGLAPPRLIEHIENAKNKAGCRITTAEPWHVWMDHPELAHAADLIFVNIHPYWEGVPVESAAEFVVEKIEELERKYPGKRIVGSETGWPNAGLRNEQSIPSLVNQKRFLQEVESALRRRRVDAFFFEAFDETWKSNEPRGVGPHWGIYTVDRIRK